MKARLAWGAAALATWYLMAYGVSECFYLTSRGSEVEDAQRGRAVAALAAFGLVLLGAAVLRLTGAAPRTTATLITCSALAVLTATAAGDDATLIAGVVTLPTFFIGWVMTLLPRRRAHHR